jgi:hypothetical protein
MDGALFEGLLLEANDLSTTIITVALLQLRG